ncbi:asparaginase [Candidatus Micrarchaeota archaeon]|nr:asparaginase [Candidatus Micrarchaeota archaeon]
MTEKIKILVTGGTFDKFYDEIHAKLSFSKTHVPQVLKEGRCHLDVEVETLLLKDSLDFKDEDRKAVADACEAAKEKRIVVTHGTDTMPETAEAVAKKVSRKTVVLTGAMIPFTFGSSDGLFNLGSALAFVQTLPPGVYLAMNGRYFKAGNVQKDRKAGVFVPKT